MPLTFIVHSLWTPPAPTPDPSLTPPPATSGGSGFGFDLDSWISSQINTWFAELVGLAIKPLLDALAATLLTTPDIDGQDRAHELWQTTLAMANGGFVLFVVVGG